MIIIPPPPVRPWTKRQPMTALRRAGWTRLPGANPIYQSPDDAAVRIDLDRYNPTARAFVWEIYATRRKLPATTRPPF